MLIYLSCPARRQYPVLLAALAEGYVLTKSVALQLAKWTRVIPEEYRGEAEEILVAAARAGADLRALAAICAEIRYRTARPDPDDENGKHLDRGVSFDTTDGAGVIPGDLTRKMELSWARGSGPRRLRAVPGPAGRYGSGDPGLACSVGFGFGDAAEGDFGSSA
jgi:hypothetical protein